MRFSNIQAGDRSLFMQNTPALGAMFSRGESRPAWCFVASEGDRAIATAGFRGHPNHPQLLKGFNLAGEQSALSALLGFAVESLGPDGVKDLLVTQDLASPTTDPVQDALEENGFSVAQEQARFAWDDPWPAVRLPGNVRVESMEQVGEPAFESAWQAALAGSADPLDRIKVQAWGPVLAADIQLDDLRGRNTHYHWWLLVKNQDGSPIGLVVPYIAAPRVGSFGVLKHMPGQDIAGAGTALLSAGTAVLQTRGVGKIDFSAAAAWAPIFAQIGGYRAVGNARVYHRRI